MTMLVTRPRRSLAMFPALGMPAMSGAPVDIEETADAFRVELDLPDVAADDVQIELRDNEIRVYGAFRERRREGMLRHHARRTGEFEYLIALPGDVNPDGVEADLDSGVLSIVAPKSHEQQARRIEVRGRGRQQPVVESPAGGSSARPEDTRDPQNAPPNTPAARAKQMKEGQSRPGPATQHVGTTGTGSTGQVGRSSMT